MEIQKINKAQGTITVPGDKSISHRAVMIGALSKGVTNIYGFLPGEDCLRTIECFKKLGVGVDFSGDRVRVYGNGLKGLKKPDGVLYTGNSGTTTRLIAGILAAQSFDSVIDGDESIKKRPMKRITKPLVEMGAEISGDYCPLKITGKKLKGIEYNSPVASAQVKSAVLLAGLFAEGETIFSEPEKSRDHTERMLRAAGAKLEVLKNTVKIYPAEELNALDINVPGDISSAAFFMVLAAILEDSCITIKNVGINPTRTGIIDVLEKMGADITLSNIKETAGEPVCDITVKSSELKGVEIGGDIIPRLIDEIPVIAVAAVFAEGKTVIKDAEELKVKETNRIEAIVNEFKRCGVDIKETDDGMIIQGKKELKGADFYTYQDHRMAMSLSILSQRISEMCTIDSKECVNISYPDFFDTLYSFWEEN